MIVSWIIFALYYQLACWSYTRLNVTNAIVELEKLTEYLSITGFSIIVYGLVYLGWIRIILFFDKISKPPKYLSVMEIILTLLGGILLIYSGVAILLNLNTFADCVRESIRTYSTDPATASEILKKAKMDFYYKTIRYTQVGLWVCFVASILMIWLLAEKGGKTLCIGLVFSGFGYIFAILTIPPFNYVPVLGHIMSLIGIDAITKHIEEKYSTT